MKKMFSVITPSYQQGQFIEETIQSVLQQEDIELKEIEYVICDGGSTDQTISILKSYGEQLRWVSEPDSGQSDAVNKGIKMTTGDIIAWINSDDVYYPKSLSIVRKIFEENPDISVVYGDANWIDEFGKFLAKYPVESWNYERLKKACYICQPAVFFRRSIVDKLGGLNVDLDYCMDYELWLRYGENNTFYYTNTLLAGARMYASNKSLGGRLNAHKEVNMMLFNKIHYVPITWIASYALVKSERENNLSKYTDQDLYKLIILLIFNSIHIAIHYNIKGIPKILLKSVFWLLFPKWIWFKRSEAILREIGW